MMEPCEDYLRCNREVACQGPWAGVNFVKQVCRRAGSKNAFTIALMCARWCVTHQDSIVWHMAVSKARRQFDNPWKDQTGIYCASSGGKSDGNHFTRIVAMQHGSHLDTCWTYLE